MSEIFLTSRDAIDLLTEAQQKVRVRFPAESHFRRCFPAEPFHNDHRQEYIINRLSHTIGHIAHSCIKEESK